MRKFLALLLVLIALPASVSAHVLETNNGIGAVLHVDPADDPIAGQQTKLYFEFNTSGGFNANNCECKLTVKQNANILTELALSAESDKRGATSYVFPSRSAYELQVSGKPKNGANFSDFKLDYTLRVDKGAGAGQSNTNNQDRTLYLVTAAIGGCILFLLLRTAVITKVQDYVDSTKKPRATNQRKPRK